MIDPERTGQGAPLWTVGAPVQTSVPDKQKGYAAGWEVPVYMFDKSSFTVTVRADEFTPENVQKLIEEHVTNIMTIRSLEGPPY